MLAGIKPTVGRVSRYGVIPITADQDTPGPMAKTVADAALMLGALEGPAPDPATRRRTGTAVGRSDTATTALASRRRPAARAPAFRAPTSTTASRRRESSSRAAASRPSRRPR
jgi:Asp-tRNA(Asn)/Glu-tRNA(Gln) amidotransferase A subunit family amidase